MSEVAHVCPENVSRVRAPPFEANPGLFHECWFHALVQNLVWIFYVAIRTQQCALVRAFRLKFSTPEIGLFPQIGLFPPFLIVRVVCF